VRPVLIVVPHIVGNADKASCRILRLIAKKKPFHFPVRLWPVHPRHIVLDAERIKRDAEFGVCLDGVWVVGIVRGAVICHHAFGLAGGGNASPQERDRVLCACPREDAEACDESRAVVKVDAELLLRVRVIAPVGVPQIVGVWKLVAHPLSRLLLLDVWRNKPVSKEQLLDLPVRDGKSFLPKELLDTAGAVSEASS